MFKGGVCGKVYTAQNNLAKHEKSHAETRFSCANCTEAFTRHDNL